ncbi:MAG: RNA methyltransferase [bacterium]
MRGYFGIGMERPSKPMNFGAVQRTAHAFGASFVFSIIEGSRATRNISSDTANSHKHMPIYHWESLSDMRLPVGCSLVGVELTDDAALLPSFRHPRSAAYILGPEWGSLSPEAQAMCDYIVKIPTSFCVNVSVAAALIMYDRLISFGGHPDRPIAPGGPKWDGWERKGLAGPGARGKV